MKKRTRWLVMVIGLLLSVFVLLGISLAASSKSAKTFSISSNSDFTKKADINDLVAKVGDVISIYFYATNGGFAQCPEVPKDIPLTVTLTDPNNHSTVYHIIIPKGPVNTYGVLTNISCSLSGKWKVKVNGDPGKGYVTVTDTFTVTGNQAALNVIPPEATILMGSSQKFAAQYTDSQGNTTPISDDPPEVTIPEALNYALFSGSSNSTLVLNGTDLTINGSTHSNNDFRASVSKLNITGTCEAATTVQLNGNVNDIHIGEIVQHASPIVMPDIGNAIIAMAQATGQTFNENKTYSGTSFNINNPIYVKGNLSINCSQFSGNGPIVATGDITINLSSLTVTNNAPVSFYSQNGNISINCAEENLKGMVYAPNGSITMNGSYLTISGRVIGKEVAIYCSKLNVDSSGNDLTSLLPSGEPQVNWSSSDPSVATIDASGLATSTGLGTCVITAQYTINNIIYIDTAQLTVIPRNLIIDPESATIPLGSTQQYQATLEDSDENLTGVTWASSNPDVATIDELTGLAASKGVGTCTITATSQFNGVIISASATLRVVSLSITPADKIISLGSTQQYNAKFTDATGLVTDVTPLINQWSSTSLELVLATISSSGLATANGLGVCLIQATYVINDVHITASTSLTIIKPTLSIIPENAIIQLGSPQQYQATLTDYDGHKTGVTNLVVWSSDKTSVATIDINSGLATSSGVGTCIITGTYIINGVSITATAQLAVVNFSITPANKTISLGSPQQYHAILTDYPEHTTDVTQFVTWSSGHTSVATIDANSGLATSSGVGTCIITGTYIINGEDITATAQLAVVNFSITPPNKTISLGSPQQYQATFTDYPEHTTDVTEFVTWSSGNTSVATIDANSGLATSSGVGTCTITGTYIINGVSITATTQLTIAMPTLSISPAISTVLLGSTPQYQAVLTDYDGHTTNVTKTATWSSNKTSVATIDTSGGATSGLATSTGGGTCTITATYIINEVNFSATATLIVVDPNMVMALIVTPVPMRDAIVIGDTQQFSAQLKYSDGSVSADIANSVVWASSTTLIATIESPGLARGNSAGISLISATFTLNNNPLTGSYLLTVHKPGGIIREWEQ